MIEGSPIATSHINNNRNSIKIITWLILIITYNQFANNADCFDYFIASPDWAGPPIFSPAVCSAGM